MRHTTSKYVACCITQGNHGKGTNTIYLPFIPFAKNIQRDSDKFSSERRNLKFQFDPWVGIAMKNVSPTIEEFTTDNRKEEIGKKLELEMEYVAMK